MGFWQRLADYLDPIPEKRAVTAAEKLKVPPPAGRTSSDTTTSALGTGLAILPPSDANSSWRLENLDFGQLSFFSPQEMIDMLIDISPEISYAIWQFQRLCNPGFEYKAYKLGTEDVEDEGAKERLDAFFALLSGRYKSIDVLLGRFFMGAYLRGAFCAELVLDSSAREPVDLVAPDPYSIRFRKKKDPIHGGDVWEPGQVINNNFISLDIPNFCYLPIDPAPASPYGRALAAPAIFPAIFSLSLLYDIKRVVMQQGYKRMDISLNTEQAMDSFSFDQQGYETLGEYMRAAIDSFKEAYRQLQPDDALIHTDLFEVDAAAGHVDADSMSAIDRIIERIEKQLSRALKASGIVLGTTVNRSEADANRQWELTAAGIKSLQHYCENMLESLLTLSLQAQGVQARVEFRFAELRAAEMLRDAQTQAMQIQNASAAYQAGFVSQDEAANMAVNHDADAPEPRGAVESDFQEDDSDGAEELVQEEEETNRVANTNGHL